MECLVALCCLAVISETKEMKYMASSRCASLRHLEIGQVDIANHDAE